MSDTPNNQDDRQRSTNPPKIQVRRSGDADWLHIDLVPLDVIVQIGKERGRDEDFGAVMWDGIVWEWRRVSILHMEVSPDAKKRWLQASRQSRQKLNQWAEDALDRAAGALPSFRSRSQTGRIEI